MATKSEYIIKTTSGGERVYTLGDMIEIMKQHLEKNGVHSPTREECVAAIDNFVSRYKYVDSELN